MQLKLDPFSKAFDISFLLPSLQGGGAEKVTLALARGFVENGFKVELIVFRRVGAFSDQVPDGVKLTELRASSNLVATVKLALHLMFRRPQVLISALVNSDQAAAIVAPLFGIRCFIVIHNTMSHRYANSGDAAIMARAKRVRKLYRKVTGLIGCGKAVSKDAEAFLQLPSGSVVPIYNPVVSDDLLRRSKEPISHPWFTPSSPPVIVSAGRLSPEKDFTNLINAFSLVKQRRDCRLLILGEGDERPKLEALVRSLDLNEFVQLAGFSLNPYAIISKSAMFVLSSRTEGLPTVLIESMACGIPVVSTDCRSGPQEILDGGKYGRLVPVENTEALASAIIQTFDDPIVASPGSWAPFEFRTVCRQYQAVVFGSQD